jgi:hypothetical protein
MSRMFSALLIAFVCAALDAGPAAAQVSGGVKAGLASSTFSYTGADPEAQTLTWRPDLVASGFLIVPARQAVSFQAEATYSRRGVRFDFPDDRVDYRLSYVELSGLLRVESRSPESPRLYALGGLTAAFKVGATEVRSAAGTTDEARDLSDAISGVDVRVSAGAGIDIRRFLIEARYTHGLRHVVSNPAASAVAQTFKTRAFEILAGVRF